MDSGQESKNSRSKTCSTISRNQEWNLFKRDHPIIEPIQICRQVIRHKRFLQSQLGQHQRLMHDHRTLYELANANSLNMTKNRTKGRNHLLNPDYWQTKKTVDENQQKINAMNDMIKEYKVEATDVASLHTQIENVWAELKACESLQEEQQSYPDPNKEEKNEQETDPLQDTKIELIQRLHKQKQRAQQLQRRIKRQINEQGRLLKQKQKLQQIKPIRW